MRDGRMRNRQLTNLFRQRSTHDDRFVMPESVYTGVAPGLGGCDHGGAGDHHRAAS